MSFVENPNLVSNFGNQYKYAMMMKSLTPSYDGDNQIHLKPNQAIVNGGAKKNDTKDAKVGFASGKLGDKTYVVMVMF